MMRRAEVEQHVWIDLGSTVRSLALSLIASAALVFAVDRETPGSITFSASDVAASDALGALVALSGAPQHIDPSILSGIPNVSLFLDKASPAGQRQAFAHALGCWWARAASGP